MILEVKGIDTCYGSSHVLQDVSFHVERKEAVALLGRNGVGKTTTLRSLMGLTPPRSGSIRFLGNEVLGKPPYALARMGMAYMPDDLRIFPDLTCRENLEIAGRLSPRRGTWTLERVEDLFPVLRARHSQKGLNLSGGEKKMLSLGRALMANPELVLLDEPSEGLAPLVVASLIVVMGEIGEKDMTLLLADQNLTFCRKVCTRGYILEKGRIVHEGSLAAIWADEGLVKRYLAL